MFTALKTSNIGAQPAAQQTPTQRVVNAIGALQPTAAKQWTGSFDDFYSLSGSSMANPAHRYVYNGVTYGSGGVGNAAASINQPVSAQLSPVGAQLPTATTGSPQATQIQPYSPTLAQKVTQPGFVPAPTVAAQVPQNQFTAFGSSRGPWSPQRFPTQIQGRLPTTGFDPTRQLERNLASGNR